MRLRNKVAVITGAGSGFGKATAERFAGEGAQLVLADINEETVKRVTEAVRACGGEASHIVVDVTRLENCQSMVQQALDQYGRMDILLNNAGIPMAPTLTEEVSNALWEKLLAVNITSVLHGCQAAIPQMKRQGSGVIINTASTAAVRPRPGLVVYAASKGTVVAFTKGLALELAPSKIRVNAISPVAGDTPMLTGFMEPGTDSEEGRRRFTASIPAGSVDPAPGRGQCSTLSSQRRGGSRDGYQPRGRWRPRPLGARISRSASSTSGEVHN